MAGRLLPAEATDLARRPTADPVAYEQFLRGNFYIAQRTAAALARAVEAYEAATTRDPAFKPARARVAYAWSLGIVYGVGTLSADTVQARAERTTAVAVRRAGDVSDTWLARGWLFMLQAFVGTRTDMTASREALARAVEIDPQSAEAHHQYASQLVILAEDSLAESEYRRALALEPGRAVTMYELGELAFTRGRFAEAEQWIDSTLAAEPRYARAYMLRAVIRIRQGDGTGALDNANQAMAFAGGNTIAEAHASHAAALAASGDTAAARREAETVPMGAGIGVATLAWVVLGDRQRALEILDAMPSLWMRCSSARSPVVQALRGDEHFERLTAGCPWRK